MKLLASGLCTIRCCGLSKVAIPQASFGRRAIYRHASNASYSPTNTSIEGGAELDSLVDKAGSASLSDLQRPNHSSTTTDIALLEDPRPPRSVQATYLRPLKRQAKHGLPSCDLQLRSYGVRNLEFFADFALRAAYYLKLPATGPVPLPRMVERWTLTKGPFVHKKKQENFKRITVRRLIQIQDGHPETVRVWLAFLRKHAYYGVGMKASVWEHSELGIGKKMDVSLENSRTALDTAWAHFGRNKTVDISEKVVEMLGSETYHRVDDGPLTGEPIRSTDDLLHKISAVKRRSQQADQ